MRMGSQATKISDTEQDRQRLMDEMSAEQGSGWLEQYEPGSFGCHELLDRTSLLADNLESYILSHPACFQNAEWYALADQAVTALRELYQRIGAAHLDPQNDPASDVK